jgi:NADH dehydrogenase [ubiquinone] 1 alpha subcomplex assembly factor 7
MRVLPEVNQLALRLAKQIEATGPISVSEYMRAANEVYYGKGDPLGEDGDFITAPEISQMFGELIGLWFTDLWLRQNRPANVNYVELGPGRGTLAADALRCMHRFEMTPSAHFVETSDHLKTLQYQAVPAATIHDSVDQLPEEGPLFILANEFFDALPVRQFVSTHAGWRERVVVRDGGNKFMAIAGQLAVDHMVPADFRSAPTNSIFETSPHCSDVIYELSTRLARQGGAMLIIDYGYSHPGLGSTLQAVKDHKYSEPFENPGDRDLTAHVNFLEISNLAKLRDLKVYGPIEQGQWLTTLGINQRAEHLAQASPERADEITSARNRLANPEEMGSLFKVLAITSPEWSTPEGFERTII